MKTYRVAVLPGDGTGPEVVVEAEKALDAAASRFEFKLDKTSYDLGGERYKRTGETLPDSVRDGLIHYLVLRHLVSGDGGRDAQDNVVVEGG